MDILLIIFNCIIITLFKINLSLKILKFEIFSKKIFPENSKTNKMLSNFEPCVKFVGKNFQIQKMYLLYVPYFFLNKLMIRRKDTKYEIFYEKI